MAGGRFRSNTRVSRRLNSSSISYFSHNNQFIYTVCIYTTNRVGILPGKDRVSFNSINVLKHLLNEVRLRERLWSPQNRKKYNNLERIVNNIKSKKQLN